MSTQYDTIQGPYDYVRETSIAYIERENVQKAIEPFIDNARVLELACGSGYYTYHILEWGAVSVVGVDISSTMIEANRRLGSTIANAQDKVKLILGDCSKPTLYPGGPFDVVFAAWLLNYAPDRAGLTDMFRNVSLNLKEGGHFVGVTIVPTMDPLAFLNAELEVRPPPGGSGFLYPKFLRNVEDGIYFHVHAHTPLGDVGFDDYHLTEDVYRAAAKDAGMSGVVNWGVTSIPERYLRGKEPGGASMEELKSYQTVPNYGVIVVVK
ncbi:MAG: hypothetical protein Q9227_001307 [Pyrenula ochraceoflavens]